MRRPISEVPKRYWVKLGNAIDGVCNSGVLHFLPAIHSIAGKFFMFQQGNALAQQTKFTT